MSELIELVEGFFVDPEMVTVVKAAGDNKCTLWVTGQGALDGFVLDYPASEVVEHLNDALYGGEEEIDEDEQYI